MYYMYAYIYSQCQNMGWMWYGHPSQYGNPYKRWVYWMDWWPSPTRLATSRLQSGSRPKIWRFSGLPGRFPWAESCYSNHKKKYTSVENLELACIFGQSMLYLHLHAHSFALPGKCHDVFPYLACCHPASSHSPQVISLPVQIIECWN